MTNNTSGRIHLIDTLRGLSIILMIVHHLAYDLWIFGWLPSEVLFFPLIPILSDIFGGLFILISGISCNFSRSNIKRGIIALLCGCAVSAVTYFVDRSGFVRFGILHFMGAAMIIYGVGRKFFQMFPRRAAMVACAVLFAVFYILLDGPVTDIDWLWMFGFYSGNFTSFDYWPLLPWIFIFIFGSYMGTEIKAGRYPKWFYSVKENVLSRIGRHTLIIYLLHQPVLYTITYVVYICVG